MIATGHQPNYLPYLGFFHKIASSNIFVIVDTVQYVKRGPFGWINRNRIRTHQGWMWLSVPVFTKGKYTQTIQEVLIDNSTNWAHKHWRAMELSYNRAPFFKLYENFFSELYNKKREKLCDLNEEIIRYIVDILGLKTKITRASVLGVSGKATGLIIDICKKTGADTYLHGKHGKDYIDQAKFTDNNIRCLYQEFHHPTYPQVYEPFIPEMSIVDLLGESVKSPARSAEAEARRANKLNR